MAGGERTGVLTLIMDDFQVERPMGAVIREVKIHSPGRVTEGGEGLTGEPLDGSSRMAAPCIPDWKMRIYRLIFYF